MSFFWTRLKNAVLTWSPIQTVGSIILAVGCTNIPNGKTAQKHMIIGGSILMILGWLIERISYYNLGGKNQKLIKTNQNLEAQITDIERLQQENSILKSDLEKEINDKANVWLKSTADRFELTETDRISIYYVEGESFYMLSRHSESGKYNEKHRLTFERSQSAICKAWEHGEHVNLDKIPAHSGGKAQKKAYLNAMKREYGYHLEKTETLTMKSCVYIAFAIKKNGTSLGIILFESTRKNRFTRDDVKEIKRYCTTENKDFVVKFIEEGIHYGPHTKALSTKKGLTDQEFMSDIKNIGVKTHE